MAAPTHELEKLIVSQKLAHGGNPVTRWMAANVAVAQDPAGNLKPAKDKSHRADRWHRRHHHGDRPRHGRPGGAPARVLHVLCLKENATAPAYEVRPKLWLARQLDRLAAGVGRAEAGRAHLVSERHRRDGL